MKLICLDVASSTGAAWSEIGGDPQWTVFKAKGASLGEKKSRYRHWLVAMVNTIKPDRIIFEAPFLPKVTTAATVRLLSSFAADVEEVGFDHGVKVLEVSIFEIARHFIGSAKIPREQKKEMTIAQCHRLGWMVDSDDAADALAIFSLAERTYAPEVSSRRWAAASLELPLAAPVRRRSAV